MLRKQTTADELYISYIDWKKEMKSRSDLNFYCDMFERSSLTLFVNL